jgi:hypothetical protein
MILMEWKGIALVIALIGIGLSLVFILDAYGHPTNQAIPSGFTTTTTKPFFELPKIELPNLTLGDKEPEARGVIVS